MRNELHIARSASPTQQALLNGDKRRHRRLQLTLKGRFMRPDRNEFECTLEDISVGSAAVKSSADVETGERIIAYFEHLGGLEGAVSRTFAGGFAFQFKITEHKREKLAAQIMWLVNSEDFPDEPGRTHERFGAGERKTTIRLADGVVLDVELIDLSATGASIGTPARPPIGDQIGVGGVSAVIRRHHEKGLGVEFLTKLSAEALRQKFP
jgi:hypothetical protein